MASHRDAASPAKPAPAPAAGRARRTRAARRPGLDREGLFDRLHQHAARQGAATARAPACSKPSAQPRQPRAGAARRAPASSPTGSSSASRSVAPAGRGCRAGRGRTACLRLAPTAPRRAAAATITRPGRGQHPPDLAQQAERVLASSRAWTTRMRSNRALAKGSAPSSTRHARLRRRPARPRRPAAPAWRRRRGAPAAAHGPRKGRGVAERQHVQAARVAPGLDAPCAPTMPRAARRGRRRRSARSSRTSRRMGAPLCSIRARANVGRGRDLSRPPGDSAMPLTVRQFPCLSDNYGFLARDEATGKTACIDTPDADAILARAQGAGLGRSTSSSTPTGIPTTPAATPRSRRPRAPRRRAGRGDAHRAARPRGEGRRRRSIWARPASR